MSVEKCLFWIFHISGINMMWSLIPGFFHLALYFWASSIATCFVNKILLQHSPIHLKKKYMFDGCVELQRQNCYRNYGPKSPKQLLSSLWQKKFVNSGFRLFELGFLASKLIKAPKEKKPNEEKLMPRTPSQKKQRNTAQGKSPLPGSRRPICLAGEATWTLAPWGPEQCTGN